MINFLKNRSKINILFYIALSLALVLIFHLFQINHEHPDKICGSDETAAFLHGEDKKWWVLLILVSFLALSGFGIKYSSLTGPASPLYSCSPPASGNIRQKRFDPLREALRKGAIRRIVYE